MLKVISFINGKKTYMVAAATIVWALLSLALGKMDVNTCFGYLVVAGNAIGFRSAINKLQLK